MDDLADPLKAATLTGTSISYLKQLRRAGKITGYGEGRQALYSLESIREYKVHARAARRRAMEVQMGRIAPDSGLPGQIGPPLRPPYAPEPDDLDARAEDFVRKALRNLSAMEPGYAFLYRYDCPPFTVSHLEEIARKAEQLSDLVVRLSAYVDPVGRRALRAEKPGMIHVDLHPKPHAGVARGEKGRRKETNRAA